MVAAWEWTDSRNLGEGKEMKFYNSSPGDAFFPALL